MNVEFEFKELSELINRLGYTHTYYGYKIEDELLDLVRRLRLALKASLNDKVAVNLNEEEIDMLIDNSTVIVGWDGIHTTKEHISALKKLANLVKEKGI